MTNYVAVDSATIMVLKKRFCISIFKGHFVISTGVLCMKIDFDTVGGKLVRAAPLLILYRYESDLLKKFIEKILPLGNKVIAFFHGSVCIIVHSEDRASLRALWHQYKDGTLERKLQDFLVTEDIRRLAGGQEVVLSLYIDPQDFKDALLNLIITESQGKNVM